MFEFFLLISLVALYYSEKIIPISDFKNETISFENGYCNNSLSYSIVESPNFSDRKLIIRTTKLKSDAYLFVYDNYDKLMKDKEKNSFDNYFFRDYLAYSYSIFEVHYNNSNKDKTFYITFGNKYNPKKNFDFNVWVYSTVFDPYICQPIKFSGKKSNFLFYIPREFNQRYCRLGFKKMTNDVLGELQILDGNNLQLLKQINQTDYYEYYFLPQQNNRYIINLTITSTSQNNDINKMYFYLLHSYENNNVDIIELNHFSKFQEFIVLKELNYY